MLKQRNALIYTRLQANMSENLSLRIFAVTGQNRLVPDEKFILHNSVDFMSAIIFGYL